MYSGGSVSTTTRPVPSGDPASELTTTGWWSGKYWTNPACAARTTYPIVAAFLKLGIPTMMSARPSRSISSRMAGVSAVWGTRPPYHSRPRQRPSAARHAADRPLLGHLAGVVTAVRGLVGQAVETLRFPGADPRQGRRPEESPEGNQDPFRRAPLEDPAPFEQRDVDEQGV